MSTVVNETLAQYSDLAIYACLVLYGLAIALSIAGYVAASRARTRGSLAATGGGSVTVPELSSGGTDEEGRPFRTPFERFGRMAYIATIFGFVLHAAGLVLRGLSAGRVPWGNMYEFVMLTCAIGTAVAIVALRKPRVWTMWPWVLIPTYILECIAVFYLYADSAPVMPALKSYWLPIHVSVISTGSGLLLLAGGFSAMYLVRLVHPSGREGDGWLATVARPMPTSETLDRFAYRTTVVAFPIFGIGVILGAIWAETAWNRYWGWDPKETVSLIAWLVYAAYLHARATAGRRDATPAVINLVGFVAMLFNLFIINLVVSGLHSYAGVMN